MMKENPFPFSRADTAGRGAEGKKRNKAMQMCIRDRPNPGQGFFRSRSGCYLRGAIIGHGDVPVKHCLMALKRAGYDGYVAIEFEGMEDAYKGLAIGLENLRRYISEIEE